MVDRVHYEYENLSIITQDVEYVMSHLLILSQLPVITRFVEKLRSLVSCLSMLDHILVKM
jgi:hypothetical protein